eukprot:4474107-Prymnesium_polylepis.2
MLPGLMRSGEWVFAASGVALLPMIRRCSGAFARAARAEFAHELTAFAVRAALIEECGARVPQSDVRLAGQWP